MSKDKTTAPKENPVKKPDLVTFGCRLNSFESEVMRTHAEEAGLNNSIIFNTCAVTAEATRQARQAIRRARRDNPEAKIIVTGCAAQINPAEFEEMPEIDVVLGNDEKLQGDSWLALAKGAHERVIVNDIMSVKETAGHMIDGLEGRARAFVQVQNGCDHRCTFCIIPYGRGNSRSVPAGEVVEQVKNLVANGYKEVVLTGVDITSYGPDLPGKPTLGGMIKSVLKAVPELKRLRISSIDSIEIEQDPDLMDVILHEARLMPHLHLSLQAGDNMILKRMKRRHSREDAIRFCQMVRAVRPDVTFGADIITGFPTETEDMFEQSIKLVDDCGLTWLHVFPYSEREGTPAAKIPNKVPKDMRKDRAARLRAKGDEAVEAVFKALDGASRQVLIERVGKGGFATGHTEEFAPVRIMLADLPKDAIQAGEIYPMTLKHVGDQALEGTLING